MFRLWAKEWKGGHMIADTVVELDDLSLTRTKKVFAALDQSCQEFDLPRPIWLESNIREFQRISKTSFTKDSFVEEVPFDKLEIQIIEED